MQLSVLAKKCQNAFSSVISKVSKSLPRLSYQWDEAAAKAHTQKMIDQAKRLSLAP